MNSSVSLAPHLQVALDAMSKDMAVDSQALVNQAVFAWLRINGYVTVSLSPAGERVGERGVAPVVAPVIAPVVPSAPPPAVPEPVMVVPPAPTVQRVEVGPTLLRMAEIDADLEKLAKPWPAWAPVQEEEEEPEEEDAPVDEQDEEPEAEEEPEEQAAEPPEDSDDPSDDPGIDANTGENDIDEDPSESTIVLRSAPIALYLEREGEEPIRITQDRFIIGRGPHCDLVIDSPRVSREHVALTRKGILFYLEDLNSSNGTWFDGERVTRRELESGDLINLGNEPMTFFLRGQ